MWAAGATLLALGIGQLIGAAIDRARPYEAMTGIHLLVDKTTDFSFPSDQATVVGAVAAGLMFTNRRCGSVAAALAVVMALARGYVVAHYPGDVLGCPGCRRRNTAPTHRDEHSHWTQPV